MFRHSPRIICCYTESGVRKETLSALESFAPGTEYAEVSGSPYDYRDTLQRYWTGKRPLIVVEQDIVIHDEVIDSFAKCSKPWCTYGFQSSARIGYLYRGLGCTKFSARLQRRFPFEEFVTYGMTWKYCDAHISRILWTINGIQPHVHGEVEHLHDFESDRNNKWQPFCREIQADGSIHVYRNNQDSTRGDFVERLAPSDWLR
jgi:hypothetical protein